MCVEYPCRNWRVVRRQYPSPTAARVYPCRVRVVRTPHRQQQASGDRYSPRVVLGHRLGLLWQIYVELFMCSRNWPLHIYKKKDLTTNDAVNGRIKQLKIQNRFR